MALPSHLYSDPVTILINRESRTCKGCRYLDEWEVFNKPVQFCLLKQKKLRKCSLYGEKANGSV